MATLTTPRSARAPASPRARQGRPARPSGRGSSSPARTAASLRSSSTTWRGRTLASATWLQLPKSFKGNKTEQAAEVGKLLAESAKQAKLETASSIAAATCTTDA